MAAAVENAQLREWAAIYGAEWETPEESCELASADLAAGDVLVLYPMASQRRRTPSAKNLERNAFRPSWSVVLSCRREAL
jgi:hypothetical protein